MDDPLSLSEILNRSAFWRGCKQAHDDNEFMDLVERLRLLRRNLEGMGWRSDARAVGVASGCVVAVLELLNETVSLEVSEYDNRKR